jgi:amidase
VETLERHGAVVLAKSNTPEFGAGANTFNEVFGATLNPWNTAKTCGGSSGGSAVALASGQVWLATGSDLGGSLRTPASFCSVVGFRPGPGRVARGPVADPFDTLSVEGPMGRKVGDVALMLDAMTGPSVEDPLALPAPAEPFVKAVDAPVLPARVGFSRDLGFLPVEAEVADICEAAAGRFAELGAAVEEARPDFSDAMDIFQVLRAAKFAFAREPLLRNHRESLKPEMVWNIEKGLALTPGEIFRAVSARARLVQRVAAFFGPYDLLLSPAASVPPFDVGHRYVEEIGGHRFDNYIDWIAITYTITLTSCPALVIPCGFTAQGLPVGLQMVGRPRGEAALLSAAALAEDVYALGAEVPIDPRSPSQARS